MACSGGAIGTLMYRSLCFTINTSKIVMTPAMNKNPPTDIPVMNPTVCSMGSPTAKFARGKPPPSPPVKFPGGMIDGENDIDG